jgi:hypothetical protein
MTPIGSFFLMANKEKGMAMMKYKYSIFHMAKPNNKHAITDKK